MYRTDGARAQGDSICILYVLIRKLYAHFHSGCNSLHLCQQHVRVLSHLPLANIYLLTSLQAWVGRGNLHGLFYFPALCCRLRMLDTYVLIGHVKLNLQSIQVPCPVTDLLFQFLVSSVWIAPFAVQKHFKFNLMQVVSSCCYFLSWYSPVQRVINHQCPEWHISCMFFV